MNTQITKFITLQTFVTVLSPCFSHFAGDAKGHKTRKAEFIYIFETVGFGLISFAFSAFHLVKRTKENLARETHFSLCPDSQ
jgi:hypothetical protein